MVKHSIQLILLTTAVTARRVRWCRIAKARASSLPEPSMSEHLRQLVEWALDGWESYYGPPPAEFEPLPQTLTPKVNQ